MFTRPPTPPLPPPDGAFRQVRRRALLRRLRAPGAIVGVVALATVSFGVTRPHPTTSLEPVASPTLEATESYSPLPEPTTPPPTPVATATTEAPSPSVDPTTPPPTPSPTPIDFYAACAPGGPGRTGPDVTGVVVDRAGHPVVNAAITGSKCTSNGGTIEGAVIATTDAHGKFSYACFGKWAVVAPFAWYTGARYSTADVGYRWLGSGAMFEPVPCGSDFHVVLPDAGTVHAHLVDKYGNPASGVGHTWVGLFDARDGATPFYTTHWTDDGQLSFTGLAPGRYFVYESPHKYVYFDVAEGQTVDVDVPYGAVTPTTPPPTTPPPTTEPPSPTPTP